MDDGSEMMSSILAAGTLGEFFTGLPVFGWELSGDAALVIAAIIHASLLMALFGLAPFFFIWAERKVSGRMRLCW
jgi:hypothetical protein